MRSMKYGLTLKVSMILILFSLVLTPFYNPDAESSHTPLSAGVVLRADDSSDDEEQVTENTDYESTLFSFSRLTTMASSYFATTHAGFTDGDEMFGLGTNDFNLDKDVTIGNVGGMMGYANDSMYSGIGMVFSTFAENSIALNYYDVDLNNGTDKDKGELQNNMANYYLEYGHALSELGIDEMGGFFAGIGRKLVGLIAMLAFAFALLGSLIFQAIVDFLNVINVFSLFQGVTDLNVTGNAGGGAVKGEWQAAFTSIYHWLYIFGFSLIGLSVGIYIFDLLFGGKNDSKKTWKGARSILVRVIFVSVGIPIIGNIYTQALEFADTQVGNNTTAIVEAVTSNFVDFGRWATDYHLAMPDGTAIVVSTDPSSGRAGTVMTTMGNLNGVNGGIEDPYDTDSSDDTSSVMDVSDLGLAINKMVDSDFTTTTVDSADATKLNNDGIRSAYSLLLSYTNNNKISDSNIEADYLSWVSTIAVDEATGDDSEYNFSASGLLKLIAAFSKSTEAYEGASGILHPFSSEPDGVGAFVYTETADDAPKFFVDSDECALGVSYYSSGTDDIKFSGDCDSNKSSTDAGYRYNGSNAQGLSTTAMFNYLRSDFSGNSKVLVYNSEATVSGDSSNQHYSVTTVSSGLEGIARMFNMVIILIVIGLLGVNFGFRLLFQQITLMFKLLMTVFTAFAGIMQGIILVVFYACMLFLSLVLTSIMYSVFSLLIFSVDALVTAPIISAIGQTVNNAFSATATFSTLGVDPHMVMASSGFSTTMISLFNIIQYFVASYLLWKFAKVIFDLSGTVIDAVMVFTEEIITRIVGGEGARSAGAAKALAGMGGSEGNAASDFVGNKANALGAMTAMGAAGMIGGAIGAATTDDENALGEDQEGLYDAEGDEDNPYSGYDVDDDGNIVDENGNVLDTDDEGNFIDPNGNALGVFGNGSIRPTDMADYNKGDSVRDADGNLLTSNGDGTFTDEQGKLTGMDSDSNSVPLDENGVESGLSVDDDGNIVDSSGSQLAKSNNGTFTDKMGNKLGVDSNGNIVPLDENGIENDLSVDENGNIVDSEGNVLSSNSDGTFTDKMGNTLTVDENGNIVSVSDDGIEGGLSYDSANDIMYDSNGDKLTDNGDGTFTDKMGNVVAGTAAGGAMIVAAKGITSDNQGNLYDEDGTLLVQDEDGNFVDGNGTPVGLDKDGNVKPISPSGIEAGLGVASNGKVVDSNGKALYDNNDGTYTDGLGNRVKVDSQGNVIPELGVDSGLQLNGESITDRQGNELTHNNDGSFTDSSGTTLRVTPGGMIVSEQQDGSYKSASGEVYEMTDDNGLVSKTNNTNNNTTDNGGNTTNNGNNGGNNANNNANNVNNGGNNNGGNNNVNNDGNNGGNNANGGNNNSGNNNANNGGNNANGGNNGGGNAHVNNGGNRGINVNSQSVGSDADTSVDVPKKQISKGAVIAGAAGVGAMAGVGAARAGQRTLKYSEMNPQVEETVVVNNSSNGSGGGNQSYSGNNSGGSNNAQRTNVNNGGNNGGNRSGSNNSGKNYYNVNSNDGRHNERYVDHGSNTSHGYSQNTNGGYSKVQGASASKANSYKGTPTAHGKGAPRATGNGMGVGNMGGNTRRRSSGEVREGALAREMKSSLGILSNGFAANMGSGSQNHVELESPKQQQQRQAERKRQNKQDRQSGLRNNRATVMSGGINGAERGSAQDKGDIREEKLANNAEEARRRDINRDKSRYNKVHKRTQQQRHENDVNEAALERERKRERYEELKEKRRKDML